MADPSTAPPLQPAQPSRKGKKAWRKHVDISLVLSLAGGLCCLVAGLTHRHLDPGLWGFLPRIGPLWYVGLGLVVARGLAEAMGGTVEPEETPGGGATMVVSLLTAPARSAAETGAGQRTQAA